MICFPQFDSNHCVCDIVSTLHAICQSPLTSRPIWYWILIIKIFNWEHVSLLPDVRLSIVLKWIEPMHADILFDLFFLPKKFKRMINYCTFFIANINSCSYRPNNIQFVQYTMLYRLVLKQIQLPHLSGLL